MSFKKRQNKMFPKAVLFPGKQNIRKKRYGIFFGSEEVIALLLDLTQLFVSKNGKQTFS